MPSRRVLLLVSAVCLASLALVVAIGMSRVGYGTPDGRVQCPDRVWSSVVGGLTDRDPDACTAAAMDRFYAVTAGVMGLVLISGLLSRRR